MDNTSVPAPLIASSSVAKFSRFTSLYFSGSAYLGSSMELHLICQRKNADGLCVVDVAGLCRKDGAPLPISVGSCGATASRQHIQSDDPSVSAARTKDSA